LRLKGNVQRRLMLTVCVISACAKRNKKKRHLHVLVRNSPVQHWCAFAPSVYVCAGVDSLLRSIDIA
jgi:hypothetical protein